MSAAFLLLANIASAFTVRYSNNDSKKHIMEVRSNGSTHKIEFNGSTTSSVSVQTSASEVEIKTECVWVKVKDGQKISIKKGLHQDGVIDLDQMLKSRFVANRDFLFYKQQKCS